MASNEESLVPMRAEMARQRADALDTFDAVAATARIIADRIRSTGTLFLYGIGGSHHVNRILEPLYLDAGIDTRAIVASDALLAPTPDPKAARVALITSQSGRSGEIVALLERTAGLEERFGITLESDGPLARRTQASLVAVGGSELAFAASRSIILSLAMHGAILEALGQSQGAARDVLRAAPPAAAECAWIVAALHDCDAMVFAGRHVMRGVAESESLSMMELARVTTLGFEGGQFRHGPFEALRRGLGVVLLRSAGPDAHGIEELAQVASDSGCVTVILDSSGLAPVPAGRTQQLPPATGLAAALQSLLFLQEVNVGVALQRIPQGVGTPLRTSKVTV